MPRCIDDLICDILDTDSSRENLRNNISPPLLASRPLSSVWGRRGGGASKQGEPLLLGPGHLAGQFRSPLLQLLTCRPAVRWAAL